MKKAPAKKIRAFFHRVLSGCFFNHSPHWHRVVINGVWTRQCDRCLEPLTAILVNDEGRDIQPAKVPAITPRHAQIEKAKRTRAVKATRPKLVKAS